jgi:hypothetical protein
MSLPIEDTDDYEYGIVPIDRSVHMSDDTSSVKLEKDDILNPFFIGINGGNLKTLEHSHIYHHYKHLYVLCMAKTYKNEPDALDIFNYLMTPDKLKAIGKHFTLVKSTMNLLKINNHFNKALIVPSKYLTLLTSHTKFDNNEIVVPIFEINEQTLHMYTMLFDRSVTTSDVKTVIDLINYFTPTYKQPIQDQLTRLLLELKESMFWANKKNCGMNISDAFNNRRFNAFTTDSVITAVSQNHKQKSRKIIDDEEFISHPTEEKNDYLNYIHQPKEFTDLYSALKSGNAGQSKRTYYATVGDTLDLKREDIDALLSSQLDDRELYFLTNSLLVSKEFCHHIVNNQYALTKLAPLFEKYKPAFRYTFGYAWLCMYIEECIFKTKTVKGNRFVFDIETASKLPVFPISFDDIKINPYATILVDDKSLDLPNNCFSLNPTENSDNYGVCNLEDFKWRFNLFTTGDPKKNVLDGINWNNFAVSGSVISACLQKKSHLFDLTSGSVATIEDKWKAYFNNYYSNSDIDLMCNEMSIFAFIQRSVEVYTQIKKNIDCTDDEIECEPIKSTGVSFTKHFFTECLSDFNHKTGHTWDTNTFIKNITSTSVRQYFNHKYCSSKIELNFSLMRNKTLPTENTFTEAYLNPTHIKDIAIHYLKDFEVAEQEFKRSDSDICYFINDFRDAESKVPPSQNFLVMKMSENIKFKIKSPKLPKSIELFRTKHADFFSVVARFHLPCVRAYYQGDNVYILPSCLTAMMTGLNIEYKYFAGVRDPIEIINKYVTRGFGVLLNSEEIKYWLTYNTVQNVGAFRITKGDRKILGGKDINSDIFKPLVFSQGLPKTTYNSPKLKYIASSADVAKIYKEKSQYSTDNGMDILKFRTISSTGVVLPYSSSVIEMYYDTTNST